MVASSSTPPSAHGASTSTSASMALSGLIQVAPGAARRERALASSMSATITRAPSAASMRASASPTCPAPTTATVRPARLCSEPKRLTTHARMAACTPAAVNGLGSPRPPRLSRGSPTTCSRPRADQPHVGGLGADVLGRDVHAAEQLDAVGQVQQRRPRGPLPGSIAITPLPPPSGSPAAADLKVMPRDSRSASRTACAGLS